MLWASGFMSIDELQEHLNKYCEHENTEVREKAISGGTTRYIKQCLNCGRSVGSAIAKSKISFVPNPFDLDLEENYSKNRHDLFLELQERRKFEKEEKSREFWEKYSAYLLTDEWKAKRQQVMFRAQGLCEGCRLKKAEQVHHLNYDHVYDELLFELVALCRDCHEKAHRKVNHEI